MVSTVTIRFARTLMAVLLAMSQVVASTSLQANSCGAESECCCACKAQANHCCCCHKRANKVRSCCHHSKAVQHKTETKSESCHRVCGGGCQQSSQQKAPLTRSNHSYELNPRICSSSTDEIVPMDSDPAIPSARGTQESHAFYAELPQELLFCCWLI